MLFDGAPIGPGASLPAVVGQYFALASDYGDATGNPTACASAAATTRLDPDLYTSSCPAGASGVVPGPSPCSTETDGGVPTDALLCGGSADDAAMAVSGLAAADVWVSRIEGIVTASSASDVPVSVVATAPSSPVLTASGYASDCAETPAAAPTSLPSSPPSSSRAGPSSESQAASSVAPTAAEGCSGVADSCASSDSTDDGTDDSDECGGGSSSPGSDSCGSDASSSSDCATAGRARRPRGRSPVSRVALLLVAGLAVARRRGSRARFRRESSSEAESRRAARCRSG
jgi:hypothetical protein